MSRAAGAVGAELALLPELSFTGFLPNHQVGAHAASLAAALVRMSSSEGVFLAAGMLENAGGILHKTFSGGRGGGCWRGLGRCCGRGVPGMGLGGGMQLSRCVAFAGVEQTFPGGSVAEGACGG